MNVLIGCERSGIIREAFAARGHNAWSCDLEPSDIPGNHVQCDVRLLLTDYWDLFIAHPPCTRLSSAGSWTKKFPDRFPDHSQQLQEAISFFLALYNAPIKKVCIENPAGVMTKIFRQANQYIDPYFFGQPQRKRTGLWLRGLPRLNGLIEVAKNKKQFEPAPMYVDKNGKKRYFTDGNTTGVKRSVSFQSIADAMAAQWG
jgi:hypothetical protein